MLHREKELPAFIFLIVLVYYGQVLDGSCRGLVKRNDMFLQITFNVTEYGHMVVVARAYKVYRLLVAVLVQYQSAKIVALVVQSHHVALSRYGDTLHLYAFLLVQPNGILVKV